MSVKRFLGVNSREAMRQVRAVLGDDALILSNRHVDGGVEILALADDEHGRMTDVAALPPIEASDSPAYEVPVRGSASRDTAYRDTAYQGVTPRQEPRAPTSLGTTSSPGGAADFAALSERLLGEMQEMREMLGRQQREQQGDRNPLARLQQRLWAAGVGPRLSAELLAQLPGELDAVGDARAQDEWLQRQLVARLEMPSDEQALFDDGGIIALVGPTGVGKTTTTAKLAARYVMRHGSQGVALVTTDSYRVGAHEQLRIYARLLGVEVHAHEADEPLDDLLTQLADKRLVIIDTVGMSQRDQRLVAQISQLSAGGRRVRLMLLLNASSHGDTLEDVIVTYRQAARAADNRLDDCILTKHDEAARLGPLLDSVIRHGLRMHYVSHGQQVPEDLMRADARALVERALSVEEDSPFTPEFTALREPAAPSRRRLTALSRGLLGQGRALRATLDALHRHQSGFALVEAAWRLSGMPLDRQRSALPEIGMAQLEVARESGHAAGGLVMMWGGQRVQGCDWTLPSGAVNARGELLASGWQAQCLPAGSGERLDWSARELGPVAHVLSRSPDARSMEWLSAWQLPWLAAAKPNQRVVQAGERHDLVRLAALAVPVGELSCRFQGRSLTLALSRLDAGSAPRRGESDSAPLSVLVAAPVDRDNGQRLAPRYWLSSLPSDDDAEFYPRLIEHQLTFAELPALTRRAWQRLGDAGFGNVDTELRLQLAYGLAAVARRLECDDDDWAMDVRAQLLSLLGDRKPRQAGILLDALVHLFTARDVFREVAA